MLYYSHGPDIISKGLESGRGRGKRRVQSCLREQGQRDAVLLAGKAEGESQPSTMARP